MDQVTLSNTFDLATLLKSSQPPTDAERVTIQESMVSTDEQPITVEAQVSEATTLFYVSESQLGKAQTELQPCLRKTEEGLLSETAADHRRVDSSSSFQNMPEDVLREICIACIGADFPTLTFRRIPLPYMLMQISSGMRHIVLTTPSIWASIHIQVDEGYYFIPNEQLYMALVCEARKWFERAGCLALSISVENYNNGYSTDAVDGTGPDPANILLDFLLSFSPRWKSIRLSCSLLPTFCTRIAVLSAVDVPQLQSIDLHFEFDTADLRNSKLFTIPTLGHLTLKIFWDPSFNQLAVNWTHLSSLTLRGCRHHSNPPATQIARILRQTKRLSFCDVAVGDGLITRAEHPTEINLPLLRVLYIDEGLKLDNPSGIIDLIYAPILEVCYFHGQPLEASSASKLFVRSPNIRELSLCYAESLTDITEVLHHCPSLTEFSLQPHWRDQRITPDANMFLKTFVQEDNTVICPHLEYFRFVGSIDFSLQTLRHFLESKQRGIATSHAIHPWRGVAIDLSGITDMDVRQQMLDLFSQKLREGVNVSVVAKKRGIIDV